MVADDDMAALEARVHPERIIRLTVKGDAAGAEALLSGIEGVTGVSTESASEADGTATFKVTTVPGVDLRDTIFFAMAEERYAVISMDMAEQSLESIFLSLTGRGAAATETTDKEEEN